MNLCQGCEALTSWHDYNLSRFAVGIVSSKTICHASWMALTLPLAKPLKACIVQVILDLLDLENFFFPSQNKCFSKTKSSCGSSAFKREAVLSAQKWEQLNRFKFYCQRYCIIVIQYIQPLPGLFKWCIYSFFFNLFFVRTKESERSRCTMVRFVI